MIVLIDADSLCYANAFAVEKDGELIHNAEPFLYARLDKAIDSIIRHTKAEDYKVFLTAGSGYRGDLTDDYKANREGMKRPILLQQAKEFLTVVHNAVVCDYYEADDVVCMEQTYCIENGIPSIIAHIDKDIDQQEGMHYRWALGKQPHRIYEVGKMEGLRSLYKQALVGDKADNIMYYLDPTSKTWKKDYGVGDKTADKMLADCATERDMFQVVLDKYMEMEKKSTGEKTDLDDLILNMHLLYMRRFEGDEWMPPK